MIIDMEAFQITLVRKRIKNLNLRIDGQGHVKVTAPMKFPIQLIYQFIHEKQDWIRKKQEQQLNKVDTSIKSLTQDELHYFMGKAYRLHLHGGVKRSKVNLEDEVIHCHVADPDDYRKKLLALHYFYLESMRSVVPELMNKWSLVIGVTVNTWNIRLMKTRWGSCHPRRQHICLNLKLIQKPMICLEYVIVHELVHLLEASHNVRFYELMSAFMPEWRHYKKQLEAF